MGRIIRVLPDDALIAQELRGVLAGIGLGDAGEAEQFRLVLLDLNIPDVKRLDGLRLLRQRFPILPIAMVSGAFD
ncbi:MAG: hypothetical protein QM690_16130 [Sphingobium sp.]